MGVQKEDRSKSIGGTLLLLVIVLLVVSMASTYLMLTLIPAAPAMSPKQTTGEVKLTIKNPYLSSSSAPEISKGVVRLTVLPAKK